MASHMVFHYSSQLQCSDLPSRQLRLTLWTVSAIAYHVRYLIRNSLSIWPGSFISTLSWLSPSQSDWSSVSYRTMLYTQTHIQSGTNDDLVDIPCQSCSMLNLFLRINDLGSPDSDCTSFWQYIASLFQFATWCGAKLNLQVISFALLKRHNSFLFNSTTVEEHSALGLFSVIVNDEFVVDVKLRCTVNSKTKLEITVLLGIIVTCWSSIG